MLVDAKLIEVVNGDRGMLAGIAACVQSECLVSAVTLMFSAIDALAALTRPIGEANTTGQIFKDWVSRFLKPEVTLNCTVDDLWGARCGVLHTYRPESDLSARNKARLIYYQWAAGPAADTSRAIPSDALVIRIEDLHQAMKKAIHEFMIASEMDADIKTKVAAHLPTLLCYQPFPSLAVMVVPLPTAA